MTAPTGQVEPTLEEFRELARTRRVIPVRRRLLADGETPTGLYRKLAGDRPGTFLLESATAGKWSRWSFVGAGSAAVLTEKDGEAHWIGTAPAGVPTSGDPLVALHETLRALRTPRLPDLPPLTGGFVGYLSYDAARRLERLPDHAVDELGLPELAMVLVTDLAALDHSDGSLMLIANALNLDGTDERVDETYADALARLDSMVDRLAQPAPATAAVVDAAGPLEFVSRTPRGAYVPAVHEALEAVRAGEVFQVQIGQRFQADFAGDALDLYRALRSVNPSPYLYLLRLDDLAVVGSSPEALVTVTDGQALLHPIAGTRPRGATPEEDAALAAELMASEKERAEHLMLVDLGRNDLGRVCAPGTVTVVELGALERYSHVWHIVSTVVGEVSADKDALDVLLACFPAGTLTGAPKVRAMQIIDELEPVRRGIYGGALGYLDTAGDLDMAIAIRTAVLTGGSAYVQASAGIVADSDPDAEEAETRAKASAVLTAVALARTLRPA
ncbi:MAG TPA: anthranilate synthase component I [Mycobacteriales bacterium]